MTIDAQLLMTAHPPVTETRPLRQPQSASVKLNVASPDCLSDSHAFANSAETDPAAAERVVFTTAFCASTALLLIVM